MTALLPSAVKKSFAYDTMPCCCRRGKPWGRTIRSVSDELNSADGVSCEKRLRSRGRMRLDNCRAVFKSVRRDATLWCRQKCSRTVRRRRDTFPARALSEQWIFPAVISGLALLLALAAVLKGGLNIVVISRSSQFPSVDNGLQAFGQSRFQEPPRSERVALIFRDVVRYAFSAVRSSAARESHSATNSGIIKAVLTSFLRNVL